MTPQETGAPSLRQQTSRPEGAADVKIELAEKGLPVASGWYASIALYGAGGIVAILVALLLPDMIPAGVGYLGAFSVALAAASVVGARHPDIKSATWATHIRLFLGIGIFMVGIFVAGDSRVAFAMLPLFVLITPTFLYGGRFALPYVVAALPMIFVVVMVTPGPARFAHAIFTTGVMAMITVSFMAAEQRSRSLTRVNRQLAYSDPLTGIANTRRLRQALSTALSFDQSFALFAIDLDNFKQVNDQFDHSTGDRVLKAVAEALSAEVTEHDLVARRGGDEFCVLISNPDALDLERLTARLAGAIERARRATCPKVTPSGSVAWVCSRPEDSISSVLQRADDALHESKRAFHEGAATRPDADDRSFDRDFALHSVAAAVDRAYEPAEPARIQRWWAFAQELARESAASVNPFWSYLVMTLVPIGGGITLFSALGLLAPLNALLGVAAGLALLLLAGLSLVGARRRWDRRWHAPVMLTSIALVSLVVASAGTSGGALIDFYVVFALFSFYVFPTRLAAFFLTICAGLFLGLSLAGDFPDAVTRSAVTICVMLVAASITVRARTMTVRAVRVHRELSEVDALTGVANLRALRLRIATAITEHEERGGEAVPMIMTVDLDRFKLVNDHYNHTVGDQMLEAVARAISECVREDEMVARRGGDEFFVLFRSSTPKHLENVVPRVRAAVTHARRRIAPELTPTASIGWVAWQPGQTIDQLILAADRVMHDEKIESRARGYAPVGGED